MTLEAIDTRTRPTEEQPARKTRHSHDPLYTDYTLHETEGGEGRVNIYEYTGFCRTCLQDLHVSSTSNPEEKREEVAAFLRAYYTHMDK